MLREQKQSCKLSSYSQLKASGPTAEIVRDAAAKTVASQIHSHENVAYLSHFINSVASFLDLTSVVTRIQCGHRSGLLRVRRSDATFFSPNNFIDQLLAVAGLARQIVFCRLRTVFSLCPGQHANVLEEAFGHASLG